MAGGTIPSALSFRVPFRPRAASRPWGEIARTAVSLLLLPFLGALIAYRLTTPPGPGPLGLVHVAEAPPAEVAGVRAVDDPLGLGALAGLRAPTGAEPADPALQLRTALPREGEPGGALQLPDGTLIRVPPDAARGAWPATVGTSVTALTAPAPAFLSRDQGVLGATDDVATGASISPPAPPPAAAAGPAGELLYQALVPPETTLPGPSVHRLFAVVALAPDGVPVGRFTTPLTLTLPQPPEAAGGRLALALYDASAGWVELPVRATNPQLGTISAQLPQPAVVGLVENRPPLTTTDAAETTADTALTLDVLANDSDPDGDPIAVFERTTLSAAGGEVRCAQAGQCTYTPPPAFTGEDTFTYGLGDLRSQAWIGNTAEGTVTVLVRDP